MKTNISKIILFFHDLVVINIILLFAVYLKEIFYRYGLFNIKPSFGNYYFEIWWVTIIFVAILFLQNLYSKRLIFWDEFKVIVISLIYTDLFAFSTIFLTKNIDFPRSILLIFSFLLILLFPISRHLLKLFLIYLGINKENILIIGAGRAGIEVAKGLVDDKELGYDIIGYLDDKKDGSVKIDSCLYQILGNINDADEVIKKFNIDAAVIALPSEKREKISELARNIHNCVKQLYIVPEMKGVAVSNAEIMNLFDEQIFLLKINNNLKNIQNIFIKNSLELFIILLIFPVALFLIFIIAILIKIDSQGPIFFSQKRIGKNGKVFKCIKFRTMYIDNQNILKQCLETNEEMKKEWEIYRKLKSHDPRITRVGKFLRQTSLDELPQIFNILKGDMNLVGPRPYIPEEKEKIGEFITYIQSIKPGITGLWQISGRNNLPFKKRVNLDVWYILNWSVWLDLIILIRTIKVILKRDGAY